MAELLTVSAWYYRRWHWGGTAGELRLFANMTWTDAFGITHPGGPEHYQSCPIAVAGISATIHTFQTPPTADILAAGDILITGVLFDENQRRVKVLFKDWQFPTDPNPISPLRLEAYNRARTKRLADRYVPRDELMLLLAQTQTSNNPASDVILGNVLTDVPPADPDAPRVVGANSPRLPVEIGTATLVAGVATVLTDRLAMDSRILLTAQDEFSSGAFHIANRVFGVSFDIVSSNPGDEGDVAYFLYNDFIGAPIIPSFPIPPTAEVSGIAAMVDSEVLVLSGVIAEDSHILFMGSEGMSGNLYDDNRIPGVSFEIHSTDGSDTGEVAWFIYNDL